MIWTTASWTYSTYRPFDVNVGVDGHQGSVNVLVVVAKHEAVSVTSIVHLNSNDYVEYQQE